jgi:hypothetical protein
MIHVVRLPDGHSSYKHQQRTNPEQLHVGIRTRAGKAADTIPSDCGGRPINTTAALKPKPTGATQPSTVYNAETSCDSTHTHTHIGALSPLEHMPLLSVPYIT